MTRLCALDYGCVHLHCCLHWCFCYHLWSGTDAKKIFLYHIVFYSPLPRHEIYQSRTKEGRMIERIRQRERETMRHNDSPLSVLQLTFARRHITSKYCYAIGLFAVQLLHSCIAATCMLSTHMIIFTLRDMLGIIHVFDTSLFLPFMALWSTS